MDMERKGEIMWTLKREEKNNKTWGGDGGAGGKNRKEKRREMGKGREEEYVVAPKMVSLAFTLEKLSRIFPSHLRFRPWFFFSVLNLHDPQKILFSLFFHIKNIYIKPRIYSYIKSTMT